MNNLSPLNVMSADSPCRTAKANGQNAATLTDGRISGSASGTDTPCSGDRSIHERQERRVVRCFLKRSNGSVMCRFSGSLTEEDPLLCKFRNAAPMGNCRRHRGHDGKGAPAIGVAAAYGIVLPAGRYNESTTLLQGSRLRADGSELVLVLNRMRSVYEKSMGAHDICSILESEANRIRKRT